jgi:hypothetical protein
MKDEKFNNLDRNSRSIILTDLMDKWEQYTKEQCEAALLKANPLCVFSNKKYRICSSGYQDTIGILFTTK